MGKAKKAKRLSSKDLAHLDRQAELMPEEVEEAKGIVDEPIVAKEKVI